MISAGSVSILPDQQDLRIVASGSVRNGTTADAPGCRTMSSPPSSRPESEPCRDRALMIFPVWSALAAELRSWLARLRSVASSSAEVTTRARFFARHAATSAPSGFTTSTARRNLAQLSRDHAGITHDDDLQPRPDAGAAVRRAGLRPSSRRAHGRGTDRSSPRAARGSRGWRAPSRSPPSSRSESETRHRGSWSRATARLSLIARVRIRSISFRISRTAAPVTSLFTAVWIDERPDAAPPLEPGECAVGVAVRLAQIEVDARGEQPAQHGVHHVRRR